MGWRFLFPLRKNLNKTKAAIFHMQAMLPLDVPFSQINLWITNRDIGRAPDDIFVSSRCFTLY